MDISACTLFRSIYSWDLVMNSKYMQRTCVVEAQQAKRMIFPEVKRPYTIRNNDPRMCKLEKALTKSEQKIQTLIRQMERLKKPSAQVDDIPFVYSQGMFDTMSSKITGLSPDQMTHALNQVDKIVNFVNLQLPVMEASLTSTLDKSVNGITSMFENFSQIILLVLLFKLMYKMEKYRLAGLLVLTFICYRYNVYDKMSSLIIELTNYLRGKQNVSTIDIEVGVDVAGNCNMRPHAQFDLPINAEEVIYSPLFNICGKILFSMMSLLAIKTLPPGQVMDSFIRRLDTVPKAVQGIGKINDWMTTQWNLCTEYMKILLLGKTREELRASQGVLKEIDDWVKEIETFVMLKERDKIDVDAEIAMKVEGLWAKGMRFRSDKTLDIKTERLVSSMMIPAKFLYDYVNTSPVTGGGPRMRPLAIWLCGDSAIGKTEMVYPFCIDMLREMGLIEPDDYKYQVYPRAVETEYFDGYKSQKIIIYDDAFQQVDDPTKPNPELFECIRGNNTFPHHLHCAAISDKNTFSQAEVIIYTTNEMNVDIKSLTCPEAFKNRMYENAYVVQLKEQYRQYIPNKGNGLPCKYKLNKSMVDKTKAIDLDIYLFQKKDADGNDIGFPIDYHQFSLLMKQRWTEEKSRSRNKLQWLRDYATRPVSSQNDDTFFDSVSYNSTLEEVEFAMKHTKDVFELEGNLALDEDKWNIYINLRDKVRNATKIVKSKLLVAWEKAKVLYLDFVERMQPLWDEAKDFIANHPWIAMMSLITIGLTFYGIYSYFSSGEIEDTQLVETFGDGIRVRSEIASSGDSKTLRRRGIRVEVASSGDQKTKNLTRPKIEVASSGDTTTRRLAKPKVEISTSGDAKTRRMKNPVIEGYADDEDDETVYRKCNVCGKMSSCAEDSMTCYTCCDIECLHTNVHSQGSSDPAAMNLCRDILNRNTYKLLLKDDSDVRAMGNVTFLRGFLIMMPWHYLPKLLRSPKATVILSQNGSFAIQFPVSHLGCMKKTEMCFSNNVERVTHRNGDELDCVLISLHKTMCYPHRDLIKHIVTQKDLSDISGNLNGVLPSFIIDKSTLIRAFYMFNEININDRELIIELDLEGKETFLQRHYYTYRVATQRGDCGSCVTLLNKRLLRKIVCMHIAGDATTLGYGTPLTQERIFDAIDRLEKNVGIFAQMQYEEPSYVNTLEEPTIPSGNFMPLGKSEWKIGQASITSLVRSRIYNMVRPTKVAPALLKPRMINGVLVDPMMTGLTKCGKITTLLCTDALEACSNDVRRIVQNNYANINFEEYARVLTYEEAVKGTDDDYMCAINRSTSPGFPYVLTKGNAVGKSKWLGFGEHFDFTSKHALRLRKDVDNLIEDCSQGVLRDVVCVDTLKDEKRPVEKVAVGKTRVFSAFPVHAVIAFRQYFLGFVAWIMHNKIDNEIAVGTNAYSLHWHQIATRLQTKGPHVIAGDFSNFDGSLNSQILWKILDIINDWYDDSENNKNIRRSLWAHIAHSTHIFNDNMYMWTHSQPSGNPMTTIVNSMYNSIVMRMAWQIVMTPHKNGDMRSFNRNVHMISYGDDNVLNISERCIDVFNQDTIAQALETIGHTYTDEDKTGVVIKSRRLDDIHFLKRGFRYDQELCRYLAPLNEDVIYDMLNWTRNTVDPDEILTQNISTAASEIALHGRDKFDIYVESIKKVEKRLRYNPEIPTYYECITHLQDDPDTYLDTYC